MGIGESSLSKKDMIEVVGVIAEAHRGGLFNIEVESGDKTVEIIARTSGKMKKFGIKLVPGDKVKVEVSPYDLTKGRITYRM